MPARLDRVTISLWRGPFELPWHSSTALLHEMGRLDDAQNAIRTFNDAGASSPVRLDRSDKAMLVQVIDTWVGEAGQEELPRGIWELRAALLDDLHDIVE